MELIQFRSLSPSLSTYHGVIETEIESAAMKKRSGEAVALKGGWKMSGNNSNGIHHTFCGECKGGFQAE